MEANSRSTVASTRGRRRRYLQRIQGRWVEAARGRVGVEVTEVEAQERAYAHGPSPSTRLPSNSEGTAFAPTEPKSHDITADISS